MVCHFDSHFVPTFCVGATLLLLGWRRPPFYLRLISTWYLSWDTSALLMLVVHLAAQARFHCWPGACCALRCRYINAAPAWRAPSMVRRARFATLRLRARDHKRTCQAQPALPRIPAALLPDTCRKTAKHCPTYCHPSTLLYTFRRACLLLPAVAGVPPACPSLSLEPFRMTFYKPWLPSLFWKKTKFAVQDMLWQAGCRAGAAVTLLPQAHPLPASISAYLCSTSSLSHCRKTSYHYFTACLVLHVILVYFTYYCLSLLPKQGRSFWLLPLSWILISLYQGPRLVPTHARTRPPSLL